MAQMPNVSTNTPDANKLFTFMDEHEGEGTVTWNMSNCQGDGISGVGNKAVIHGNDVLEITLRPKEGWTFLHILIDGKLAPGTPDFFKDYKGGWHYLLQPVRDQLMDKKLTVHSVRAVFYPVGAFTVSLVQPKALGEHGEILPGLLFKEPDYPNYQYGARVKLIAKPNAAYHLVSWTKDLTGAANERTVTVTQSMEVGAEFAEGAQKEVVIEVPVEDRISSIESRLTKAGL